MISSSSDDDDDRNSHPIVTSDNDNSGGEYAAAADDDDYNYPGNYYSLCSMCERSLILYRCLVVYSLLIAV